MKITAFSMLLSFVIASFAVQSPDIGNTRVFPADNPWNWDISTYQVHPNSANFIASIGAATKLHPDFGSTFGIPYVSVNASQPKIPINFTAYGDESDSGPYPIPLSAPVEGGAASTGDRHVLAVDTSNKMLYELYAAYPQATQWNADCGAKFNLNSNQMRPAGWTSTDAAGLPVFAGLVRYEEVYIKKAITHAVRFTVVNSQKAYYYPARHYASSSTDPNRPPMGLRVRLKAAFDISTFSQPVQVILTALKKYGMLMADNGSNWYITGAPDDRWDDNVLGELKSVAGSNFEAVLTVDASGNPIFPAIAVEKETAAISRLSVSTSPNPFKSRISIALNSQGPARISIVDISGRKIREWNIKGASQGGDGRMEWAGTNALGIPVPAGIYFLSCESAAARLNRTMTLLK